MLGGWLVRAGGFERKKTASRCLGKRLSPAGTAAADMVTEPGVRGPSDWKTGRWLVTCVLTQAAQEGVGEGAPGWGNEMEAPSVL